MSAATISIKTAKNGLLWATVANGRKIVVSPEMLKILQTLATAPKGMSSESFYSVLWDYPHFSERRRVRPEWRHLPGNQYTPYTTAHRASLARLVKRLALTGLMHDNGAGWCTLTAAGERFLKSVSDSAIIGQVLTDHKEEEVG